MSPSGSVEVDGGGIDDTLRLLLRDLAKESVKPTIRRARVGQRSTPRGGTVARMNTALVPRLLVALSIVYGAIVAIAAVTGYADVGVLASVGGVIVGACWALYAVLVPKRPNSS